LAVDVVVGWPGIGWRGSAGWNKGRNEENEPRRSSWFVFVTHYMGLPHPGSPLVFPPPPFLHRANLSRPHPSGKGRGGCSGGWRFQGDAVGLSPHPSREGRGSLPDCRVCLRAKWGGEGEGGRSGMGGGRVKLNRDGVDVSFKLRSPS